MKGIPAGKSPSKPRINRKKRPSKSKGGVKHVAKPSGVIEKPDASPKESEQRETIEKLASIGCNYEEIATIAKCSTKTLQRKYGSLIENGRAKGRMSLRKAQFEAAVNEHNPAMLIWLGKQWLGQKDSLELGSIGGGPLLSPVIHVHFVSPKATPEMRSAEPQKQLPETITITAGEAAPDESPAG